ncbi:hypothetical protein D3Z50_15985 [Clostridiaceae bacterium]|nr:hypothetical protein [Clostridiaceae bacterium]
MQKKAEKRRSSGLNRADRKRPGDERRAHRRRVNTSRSRAPKGAGTRPAGCDAGHTLSCQSTGDLSVPGLDEAGCASSL